MRAHHVALQLIEIGGGDPYIGQQPDTRVHAVDRRVARSQSLYHGTRPFHLAGRMRRDNHFRATRCDRANFL